MRHGSVLAALAIGLCASSAFAAFQKSIDASGIKTIRVNSGGGSIDIGPADGGTIQIRADFLPGGIACNVYASVANNRLVVRTYSSRASNRFFNNPCPADFVLRFPGSPSLDIAAGSGSVSGDSLSSPVQVVTDSGNVRLTWTQAPARGNIQATAKSGTVTLAFPPGTQLAASLRSASGTVTNPYSKPKNARLKVQVTTGSGDITLQ